MSRGVTVVRPLQTGWWENVLLVEVDGQRRVRKELHRLDAPWARDVFIKEWRYLRDLPASLRPPFVSILAECDELRSARPPDDCPLWFDMEYLDGFSDVRALLADGYIDPRDAERIQDGLIAALLDGLYHLAGEPFQADRIVWPVIEQVLSFAMQDDDLADYARADVLTVNDTDVPNLRRTWGAARADDDARRQLDDAAAVRLHGDLFYENVLYRADPPAIRLVDPVSVAGVAAGPIVFDRVKFASWLSGELYELRHGGFTLQGDPARSVPRVNYAWSMDDPVLRHLREVDLGGRVLEAMDERVGPSDEAQAVLHAYFNLAMVPNTPMPQKLLRYARAAEGFARWG